MPPGWAYAVAFAGAIALVAAAMVVFWTRRARRAPIDDMIGEEGPPAGCDCEDCEDMRQHPPDCACEESCWPAFVQRMRDIAARQAADLNRRRP